MGTSMTCTAALAPKFVDECFGTPSQCCMVQAVPQDVWQELVQKEGNGQAAGGPSIFPYTQTHQLQSWKAEQALEHALGHSPAAGAVVGASMAPSSLQDVAASAPEHKYCLHRPFSHVSLTFSTAVPLPCPPPPFCLCRRERKPRSGCSYPPDARTRRGLTDPPHGAPKEMKPPMYWSFQACVCCSRK